MQIAESRKDVSLCHLDGRLHDLEVREDLLTFRLRKAVGRKRQLAAVLLAVLILAADVAFLLLAHRAMPGPFDFPTSFFVAMIQGLFWSLGFAYIGALLVGDFWEIKRPGGRFRFKRNGVIWKAESSLRAVKAWRRGDKFYVSLEFEKQSLQLGRFSFAVQEDAWREDAERIAEFLGVPLEIS